MAVGGDDLDRTGQVGDRGPVEEHPFVGQADVGQQVAVRLRLGGEHPADVGSDHQPGHSGVAAEELVAHRDDPHVVATEALHQRGEHPRAELAGEDADRCRPPGPHRDRSGDRVGAQSGVGRRIRRQRRGIGRGEEAAPRAGRCVGGAGELHLERTGHPDAVLVHRETVVAVGGRERAVGHEVVLVGGVHEGSAERRRVHVLPVLDGVDDRPRLGERVRAHVRLGVELRHPEGDDRHLGELGILVEDAGECVVEGGAVVDAGTDDDLTAHLDPVVEQGAQPAQARRPRGLRNIRARRSGSVEWMLTWSGESRSVITRSRSASVKRVRVVKFP